MQTASVWFSVSNVNLETLERASHPAVHLLVRAHVDTLGCLLRLEMSLAFVLLVEFAVGNLYDVIGQTDSSAVLGGADFLLRGHVFGCDLRLG